MLIMGFLLRKFNDNSHGTIAVAVWNECTMKYEYFVAVSGDWVNKIEYLEVFK